MKFCHLQFGFLLFCVGCASVPYDQVLPVGEGGSIQTISSSQVTRRPQYLKDLCDRYQVDWQFDRISQVVTLSKYNNRARVLIGSQVVIFDKNRKVVLNKPLTMEKNGSIVAPADFRKKVFDYFKPEEKQRANYTVKKVRKVVIDAGHGGKDSGALSKNGIEEKDVVLDIVERIGRLLRKEGLDVIYTRSSDKFISLQERTEIASKEAADLFISIHANSAKTRSAAGVEVFHLKPLSSAERREKQRLDNQKYLHRKLKTSDNGHVHSIIEDLLYTHKQADSYHLAQTMSHKLSKDIKARNRGQKNSRFFVLRNTLIPAVLVEVGFLSNPREEKKLKANGYRQRIARSISESIIDYAKK